MTSRFMEFVETPFPGYRILPQFAKLISVDSPEVTRPTSEYHGRPYQNVLSAFYLGFGSKYAEAANECQRTCQYPGQRSMTTFFAEHDPHRILEQMRRDNRNN